ncbi:MAG: hypothetical protein ING44_11525 [Telmatospirillum sp.]|nr:hypothetical protein [Telmatospirillum sp.]
MRALKAVVLSLGALCVAAFGVLVYLVVAGIGGKDASAPQAATTAPPLAGLRWNDLSLGQPAGTRIVGVVASGGLLAIHVEAPGGAGSILLVDPLSGQVRGRILPGTSP